MADLDGCSQQSETFQNLTPLNSQSLLPESLNDMQVEVETQANPCFPFIGKKCCMQPHQGMFTLNLPEHHYQAGL
jgi:hypothetical protein